MVIKSFPALRLPVLSWFQNFRFPVENFIISGVPGSFAKIENSVFKTMSVFQKQDIIQIKFSTSIDFF